MTVGEEDGVRFQTVFPEEAKDHPFFFGPEETRVDNHAGNTCAGVGSDGSVLPEDHAVGRERACRKNLDL